MEPRRRSRRIPLNVAVEYEGFERFHPDRTLNLASGGLFILSRHPLPLGRTVTLRFELPDLNLEIRVSGRVIWTPAQATGSGRHHPMGMAVRFDDEDAVLRRLLETYVEVEAEVTSAFSDLETAGEQPRAADDPHDSKD